MTATPLSPGKLAQLACICEVTARKPGNVHRFNDFDDLHFLEFLLSASMIAEPLDRAWSQGVGQAVLDAVKETRRVVSTNTNLGMILLMTPLAAVSPPVNLRNGVRTVLRAASKHDAKLVYEAIRLAEPGGLGTVAEQDVARDPTIGLIEAMRLAADRDLVARQYVNGYAEVFDLGLVALRDGVAAGMGIERAIVRTHLVLLANRTDTLIERKFGPKIAAETSRRAEAALSEGRGDPDSPAVAAFDAWLRRDGHRLNPGATADLVAAAIYVAFREDVIPFPAGLTRRDWIGSGG